MMVRAPSSGSGRRSMQRRSTCQRILSDDMTLCLDMGSFHIWLARYLYSFRARQVLISNGQRGGSP
jgi:thiamine pyrophosphate-dependent acetolactate synthase large subunit-like protein